MRFTVKNQLKYGPALKLLPISHYTGIALPLEAMDVPSRFGGEEVLSVSFVVMNADGVRVTAPASLKSGVWGATIAAKSFPTYGFIPRGVAVVLVTPTGSTVAAYADLEIYPDGQDVEPGSGPSASPTLGADQYLKSEIVDGVQHYKRVEIRYDADMADWGFILVGDFILEGNEMVEVKA